MTDESQGERIVLVHVNVRVPAGDERTADQIGQAILDGYGDAVPPRVPLEAVVVLAEEV